MNNERKMTVQFLVDDARLLPFILVPPLPLLCFRGGVLGRLLQASRSRHHGGGGGEPDADRRAQLPHHQRPPQRRIRKVVTSATQTGSRFTPSQSQMETVMLTLFI